MESTCNASFHAPLLLDAFHDRVQEAPAHFDPSMQQPTDPFTRLLLLRSLQVFSQRAGVKNVHIVGYFTPPGRWLTGFLSGHRGDEMLQWGFEKTKALAKPFALPTLGRYIVFATGPDHYEEINRASGRVLSLGGMIHDRIYPAIIMDGLTEHDYENASSNSQYVLKRRLRSSLPQLHGTLKEGAKESIKIGFETENMTDDWKEVHLYSSATRIFLNLNNYILVGKDLATQHGYLEASLKWSEDATMTEEILQFTPSFLHSLVGKIIHWRHSKDKFMKFLLPYVEKRLQERRENPDQKDEEHHNSIAWICEKMKHRSPLVIARHAMALTFAATHQPPMLLMFTLYNLCNHPEYLEPLRQEALEAADWQTDNQNLEMPLLDSFIKETARMEPGSLMGVGRRVNSDFTFKDGTHVPKGNWVAVHHYGMQRHAESYTNPDTFEGFRFVKDGANTSRLTHGAWNFTFWGSTKQGCPARFYTSVAMKLLVTHILLNYDMKLADGKLASRWNLGLMQFPNPRINLLLRKRSH